MVVARGGIGRGGRVKSVAVDQSSRERSRARMRPGSSLVVEDVPFEFEGEVASSGAVAEASHVKRSSGAGSHIANWR